MLFNLLYFSLLARHLYWKIIASATDLQFLIVYRLSNSWMFVTMVHRYLHYNSMGAVQPHEIYNITTFRELLFFPSSVLALLYSWTEYNRLSYRHRRDGLLEQRWTSCGIIVSILAHKSNVEFNTRWNGSKITTWACAVSATLANALLTKENVSVWITTNSVQMRSINP